MNDCASSHRPRWRFDIQRGGKPGRKCLLHAVFYAPVLRVSLMTAVVVGTVLIAINQGNVLLDGRFPNDLWWKIPLTYCVPFCVATFGALRVTYKGR
ncbi:MAG: nitrate/nitrite transporter NrtS [Dehalococcoidia bacterium]